MIQQGSFTTFARKLIVVDLKFHLTRFKTICSGEDTLFKQMVLFLDQKGKQMPRYHLPLVNDFIVSEIVVALVNRLLSDRSFNWPEWLQEV